jgi:hypothetical protein
MCYGLIRGAAYVRYGTIGTVLGKQMEKISWAFVWLVAFFLCLATDAEATKFMNRRFPDSDIESSLLAVVPTQIFVEYMRYGPVSVWLFPARHIYWYCRKGGDRRYFYSKLFVLLAIGGWLCVFCQYRVTIYGADAFVVTFTLNEWRKVAHTMYAVAKWTGVLTLPLVLMPAAIIFEPAIRFLRRNERLFLGRPGVHFFD